MSIGESGLKKMREEMQVWYAGLDRLVQRLQLARVTMMV